jgi:Zn-dependent peptidase ImmA (M78 family)/DNA-binding XRE family transcriptional regulator
LSRQGLLPVGPDDWHLAAHLFRAEQLTLARELRGFTKVELAARIGKTASAISQFETGRTKPDVQTIASLQLALQVPLPFFTTASQASALTTDSAFFRSLRSTSQKDRRRLLARGTVISAVVRELENVVQFPAVDSPFLDIDVESPAALEEAALELRRRWGMGLGPISNIVHLLESKGILVAEIPDECADVDAFSVRSTYRPIVFLVGNRAPSRCRFDAAHELAHLTVHADVAAANPDMERQAHRLGSAFLCPQESFLRECPTHLNIEHFYELKRRWRVSVQALVRRAFDLGVFSEATYRRAFVRLGQLGERTAERCEPAVEHPTLFRQALGLLPDRAGFCARLGLTEVMLEQFLRSGPAIP